MFFGLSFCESLPRDQRIVWEARVSGGMLLPLVTRCCIVGDTRKANDLESSPSSRVDFLLITLEQESWQEQGAGSHRQLEATRLACAGHLALDNPSNAQRLARELLRLAQVEAAPKVLARATTLFASVQLAAGNLDSETGALSLAEQATRLCRESGDLQAEAKAVLMLLQATRQKLEKAPLSGQDGAKRTCLQAMQIAFRLAELQTGLQLAVELLEHLAEVMGTCGTASEALPLATRLRAVCEEDASLHAPVLATTAGIMFKSSRWNECCTFAQDAARLFEESGKQHPAACALSLVAQAQMKLKKCSASRQNARRARRRFGEAGDHEQEIRLRLVVVRACLAKDERGNRQQRDAFREAQEAMKMAAELGKPDLMVSTLAAYAMACYEMDQHETWLNFHLARAGSFLVISFLGKMVSKPEEE